MNDTQTLHTDQLAGGCHWSLPMRRGTLLRLTDLEGGANVGMLFYNPNNLLERYNAPDTLKCQLTFKLSRGNCLYSDMGRIFCSIVEDSLGWHDTVCGNTTQAMVTRKWGVRRFQEYRHQRHQDGYTGFLVELAKYGLGKKDMAANVNFFSRVGVDDTGALKFVENHSRPGDSVELRFEMDTLVLLHACPHPLNPAADYPFKPIQYQIGTAATVAADDYCLNFRPENARGFRNNALYHLDVPG